MVKHSYSLQNIHLNDSWLTIGTFDGVHLGHQAILSSLRTGAQASNAPAVVLSFHPQPAVFLGKRQNPSSLTTPEERAVLMGELGIDLVITYPFDQQTATTPAQSFIELLKEQLGFSWLGMGEDFALGKGRHGDVNFLRSISEQYAYQLQVFSPVELEGEVISSSRIRAYLAEGDIRSATSMLGRPYRVSGEVVEGDKRGRMIGIPTANLLLNKEKLAPASGVYACRAKVGDEFIAAAVNIGTRPTFDGEHAKNWVEAHLIDFSGDLYGQHISLDFCERLRGEQRFPGVEELLQQIRRDIQKTREVVTI